MSALGIIGALGGGLLGGIGSIVSANKQAEAERAAISEQQREFNQSQQFAQNQWNTTQANAQPFLKAGQGAVAQLSDLTNTPGQGLLSNYSGSFTAPTAQQAQQTPGYQFTLNQGEQALDRGAAARGSLLTGGTGEAEQQYGQGLASQTYQQTYNNALTQYQQAYNQFQQGQANTYNRLAGLAGTGQVAAQTLGNQGAQASNTMVNLGENTANQIGNYTQNLGSANASGYAGAANNIGGALTNIGSYAQLSSLLNTPNSQSAIGGPGSALWNPSYMPSNPDTLNIPGYSAPFQQQT